MPRLKHWQLSAATGMTIGLGYGIGGLIGMLVGISILTSWVRGALYARSN